MLIRRHTYPASGASDHNRFFLQTRHLDLPLLQIKKDRLARFWV
jgi:hypothetical protein